MPVSVRGMPKTSSQQYDYQNLSVQKQHEQEQGQQEEQESQSSTYPKSPFESANPEFYERFLN